VPESKPAGIVLDESLNAFLTEVQSGQSLALAAWAADVLQRDELTMRDLERCFALGFDR